MVNLINAENISKTYGLKTLLDQVSLGINSTDRIGVVGLNGGGKSTLINLLAGLDQPDDGRISRSNELALALVEQDNHQQGTVGEVIVEPLGLATYEWASNPKVREVLEGLHIDEIGLDRRMEDLSGGQRRRVVLAAALVKDSNLIVLDEPTNHLDVEAVQWLAEYLLKRNTALLVVTHDRWFLDTIANTTWEVHDGTVDVYEGGYNDWIFARAERDRQAQAVEHRRAQLAKKELAWLRRGAPARTSKPRYRIEAAEEIIAGVPAPRDSVELMSFSAKRQGKKVIEFSDSSISVPGAGPESTLLEHLTWNIGPGERIGIVGVNGSGKTTLMKAIAGDDLVAGRVEGKTVELGFLRQELDDLDPQQRVLDSIEDVALYVHFGDKELSASQLAERLGFSAARLRNKIGDLSGGERRRLQLTRVLMAEPNVLLLDEPTNDLDIDTLQELESLLDNWAGTLIVISHDRYFVERIADTTLALMGDKKLTNFPGGIEQYLTLRTKVEAEGGRANINALTTGHTQQESALSIPTKSGSEIHALQKEISALERKMSKNAARIEDIQNSMGTVDPKDYSALTQMNEEIQTLRDAQDELEGQWLTLSEELE